MVWSGARLAGWREGLAGFSGGFAGSVRSIDRRQLEVLGRRGVAEDRLAGVDEVEIATLDRGLRLELPAAAADLGQDLGAVIDHRERALGALELLDQRRPRIAWRRRRAFSARASSV